MKIEQRRNFIVTAFDILTPIIACLNDDGKSLYSTKLKALRERFYDPEFRLAVVGNFNCGKSTFLNALLRKRLLTTDILPTTAIPTYIRWNKETLLEQTGRDERRYCNPIIKLTMTDGKAYTLTRAGKSKFEQETKISLPSDTGAIIDMLTTTNALIDKIESVDLTFPERNGFDSFCLIDTPGINPGSEENKEHILQTQKVLREDADAVILLYPATQTMTRDTEEFMLDNAAHLMTGAIILLTKKDLIPKREVEKIIKYTAKLVKKRFNQTVPKIYAISAQAASDFFSGDGTDKKSADNFDATINEIIAHLSESRSEIILRRISELIVKLIESISQTITADLKDLEEKRVTLKKYSAENLERDFGKLFAVYENFFIQNKGSYLRLMGDKVCALISSRREKIFQKIHAAKTLDSVDECLKNFYPTIMADIGKEILDYLNAQIAPPVNRNSQFYAKKLEEHLSRYERYLGTVNAQVFIIKSERIFETASLVPVFEESFTDKISNVVNFFRSNFDSAQLAESLGSALNTAEVWLDDKVFSDARAAKIKANVIQNLKIAGRLLSKKFSLEERTAKAKEVVSQNLKEAGDWLSDKMLAKRKDTAKDLVAQNLSKHEAKLIAACTDSITQIIMENLTWARNLLKEYKASYQTIFEEIEKKHNESINEVERQIVHNKKNIGQLENLKKLSTEV
ncbi:MAG: dynamin family protein [Selenomonadaceae bacterium]|nr:dynamin family protein [Selenomonadaceae bacterium]